MIDFALVTLDGTKFQQSVYEIIVPTPEGYISIFPHHIPVISLVSAGVISIRKSPRDPDNAMELYAVSGGAIEILDNVVRVLADEADHDSEINEQEAEKALQEAKNLLKNVREKIDLDKAQAMIDRQGARLQVASLR